MVARRKVIKPRRGAVFMKHLITERDLGKTVVQVGAMQVRVPRITSEDMGKELNINTNKEKN